MQRTHDGNARKVSDAMSLSGREARFKPGDGNGGALQADGRCPNP